jgi:hypothetical protein
MMRKGIKNEKFNGNNKNMKKEAKARIKIK